MRDGAVGSKVAMVNVADAFGIELAEAARPALKAANFEIVYDKSYPLGTPDMSPVMKGAKEANPDAFIAWSYPPDTFALTEQAIIQKLDVKMFYTAVATCFPAYGKTFGDKINGAFGAGGVALVQFELWNEPVFRTTKGAIAAPSCPFQFVLVFGVVLFLSDLWSGFLVYITILYIIAIQYVEGLGAGPVYF